MEADSSPQPQETEFYYPGLGFLFFSAMEKTQQETERALGCVRDVLCLPQNQGDRNLLKIERSVHRLNTMLGKLTKILRRQAQTAFCQVINVNDEESPPPHDDEEEQEDDDDETSDTSYDETSDDKTSNDNADVDNEMPESPVETNDVSCATSDTPVETTDVSCLTSETRVETIDFCCTVPETPVETADMSTQTPASISGTQLQARARAGKRSFEKVNITDA